MWWSSLPSLVMIQMAWHLHRQAVWRGRVLREAKAMREQAKLEGKRRGLQGSQLELLVTERPSFSIADASVSN